MSRVLKTLLLWLMMIALPLQGVAGVVKASCGPNHHATAASVPAGMHHDGMHQHAAVSQDDAAGSYDDDARLPASSYCSACAACCAGASAPPAALSSWSPAAIRPLTLFPAPDSRVAGFIPGGPERPPRHFSA